MNTERKIYSHTIHPPKKKADVHAKQNLNRGEKTADERKCISGKIIFKFASNKYFTKTDKTLRIETEKHQGENTLPVIKINRLQCESVHVY